MARSSPSPASRWLENMADVRRLVEIHHQLTGDESGRRYGVEVLNKSAVVLITACLEALMEDLAAEGFDFLLARARSPDQIPTRVRTLASDPLRSHPDQRKVWELAGDGWKSVLQRYKREVLARFIRGLNTPKSKHIDRLFKSVLGIPAISSCWHWPGMSARNARTKLDGYVRVRGAIAHRSVGTQATTKAFVLGYEAFAFRIAGRTCNEVSKALAQAVGVSAWRRVIFRKRR